MKRFEVHIKEDGRVHFAGRPSAWAEFKNLLVAIRSEGIENDVVCFVKGKEVSIQEGIDAAIAEGDKAYDKKCETHKQICWLAGACENTRRYAWVRK
jgi:hypothetical protein